MSDERNAPATGSGASSAALSADAATRVEREIRAMSDTEIADAIHCCRVSGSKRGGGGPVRESEVWLLSALWAEQARRASA